jgi:hypothetical protein
LHNAAQRVDFLHRFFNLQTDLFDFIGELLKESLCLLVDILGEDIFPVVGPFLQSTLDVDCLQGKGTDLECSLNFINLIHEFIELF